HRRGIAARRALSHRRGEGRARRAPRDGRPLHGQRPSISNVSPVVLENAASYPVGAVVAEGLGCRPAGEAAARTAVADEAIGTGTVVVEHADSVSAGEGRRDVAELDDVACATDLELIGDANLEH